MSKHDELTQMPLYQKAEQILKIPHWRSFVTSTYFPYKNKS